MEYIPQGAVVILVGAALTAQAGFIVLLYRRYSRLTAQYERIMVQHVDLRQDISEVRKKVKALEELLQVKTSKDNSQQQSVTQNLPIPDGNPPGQCIVRLDSWTSESDYADALSSDDFEDAPQSPLLNNSLRSANASSFNQHSPATASTTLDSTSRHSLYETADEHHSKGEGEQAYNLLKQIYDSDASQRHNSEVLWRLARACHQIAAKIPPTDSKKKDIILEGYALEAVKVNENSFNCLKWAAVLHGGLNDFLGTKEKIENGFVFKGFLDKALAIDPAEYSLLHMRGRFSFNVAGLSWLERNLASALFATPPKATYDDAIADFLEVVSIKPQWIDNLFYVAKSYIGNNDKANAAKYLNMASEIEPADDAEREIMKEVQTLMKKYK
ncbi:regulator of microtubule dynamics protein 1 [Ditylenchus destructor]|nr:regulator of microtubule dynamics protein 1 [Ditylenchus destructor]